MSASADKVQYLLQQSLQQSLHLVKRGIFTQSELQNIMLQRQKCQHAMLKNTYQMTDYLAAIEYQYEVERERRKRMEMMSKIQEGTNPLFRKESAADYAIVKRIIRLWDRTMHKYKFELRLWKQYLSFAVAIQSKKHFYKALTNALRFLPFEVELWKLGALYQMEKGLNMWKGRKLLIKGLKMVPQGTRNLTLSEFMISYQVQFLKKIVERNNILIKGEAPMRMIGQQDKQIDSEDQQVQEKEPSTMKIDQYDQLIWLIIEESINKNCNNNHEELKFYAIKERILKLLRKHKSQEDNKQVKNVITKVLERLNEYEGGELGTEAMAAKQEQEIKIEGMEEEKGQKVGSYEVNAWKEKIVQKGSQINWQTALKALKNFCLKPEKTAQLYGFLFAVNPSQTITFIHTKRGSQKLPCATIQALIGLFFEGWQGDLPKLIKTQIDRWIAPQDIKNHSNLFSKIVAFNAQEGRFESTTRLLRSLSIAFRHQPEYLALCNQLATAQ